MKQIWNKEDNRVATVHELNNLVQSGMLYIDYKKTIPGSGKIVICLNKLVSDKYGIRNS